MLHRHLNRIEQPHDDVQVASDVLLASKQLDGSLVPLLPEAISHTLDALVLHVALLFITCFADAQIPDR